MSRQAAKSKRIRIAPSPNDAIGAGAAPPIENSEAVPTGIPIGSAAAQPAGQQVAKEPTAGEIYGKFHLLINEENPLSKLSKLREYVRLLLKAVLLGAKPSGQYNWLIIHDPLVMTRPDADRIYQATSKLNKDKDIGLIITSGGGQIEPAYLISKLCRETTSRKFVAVVPRRAKSGATLICCGADEIHMGQMSELGPIDPQIDNLPALGLKNAVQHLAELAGQFPKASEMLATYLAKSLKLVNLGHYERVAESAAQYADRLLQKRTSPLKSLPLSVARQLVYGYKDHNFMIDRMEAELIFGSAMIKSGTPEYELGNSVYEWLSLVETSCDLAGYSFFLYGAPDSDCNFVKKSGGGAG